MKRIYFFYFFIVISITLIFFLYFKIPKLDVSIKKSAEELVFYDDSNEIKGVYLDVEDPILDIFAYLTYKRNALPLNANTHANSNVILNEYKTQDFTVSLTISMDTAFDLESFVPLLFESYYTLGYQKLEINIGDKTYNYDSLEVFKIADYETYKVINLDGSIRKNYQFDDNEIILEVLYIKDFNVLDALNDIDGISYELNDTFINIEIIDTMNKNLIIHLIKLNLNGMAYSFQTL